MTSINSLSSTSSATSIYGNRNVISGLASGMDTETMIENAVAGYKNKIIGLQQKQEQVQWKQEAYRSIIDKMVSLTRKYTSYTSSTNLFSPTFFNKAVTATTNGAYKDLISAIGKTSSDVQINGVKQLAQAAKMNIGLGSTALKDAMAKTNADGRLQIDGGKIDLEGKMDISNISGSMSITYGSGSVALRFDELETFKSDTKDNPGPDGTVKTATEKLVDAINKKLGEAEVRTGTGSYVTASDRILAKVDEEGKIVFEDKSGAGNSIYISSATKNMQAALGFKAGEKATSMTVNEDLLTTEVEKIDYVSNRNVSFTLDGVTKNVNLGALDKDTKIEDIQKTLQDSLNKQFGNGKVQVGLKDGGLTFDVANGSTLNVRSDVGEMLGLGKEGITTYLDTSKSLKDLGLSGLFDDASSTQEATVSMSDLIALSNEKLTLKVGDKDYEVDLGEVKYTTTASEMAERINEKLKDSGVEVKVDRTGKLNFTADADTKFTIDSSNRDKADIYAESKKMQELTVNGTSVGKFSEDASLTSVMNAINGADTGIKISYSKMTNEFSMVAKDTGAQGNVQMSGKLAEMFGFGGDMDKFSQFANDELGMMGVVNAGLTKTETSNGAVWTDENGNEMARKIVGADGTITLQRRSLDSDGNPKLDANGKPAWINVARQVKDTDGGVILQNRENGQWVDSLRQIDGRDGSVITQKAVHNADGNVTWQEIGSRTEGQDAIFTATVNGKEMELTRASNTVDMDGMSITLKGTFGYKENDKGQMELDRTSEPVTFTTSSDVDTIKDAIKSFVNDYNEMVKEIHDAYSTMPNEKSSKDHSRYLPLTEEDKKDMSESAIKAYEEKAKQGLLFGSSDLSNLYRQLTNTIQMSGADANSLSKIGIKTSYSDGLTTLELDENVLTDALKNNPDSVRDAFSRSVSNGASSDGLMYNLKSVLDTYANTSTGSMGLLIQQAGSSYAPNSVNSNNLQKEYDNFTAQIEKWQDKMSDKVDYYTRQFTALEQLIAQMNNQSSMLSGLQGGY